MIFPQISLLPPPAETAESVNLEHEAIPSKVLSAYDSTQKKLSDLSHVSYYHYDIERRLWIETRLWIMCVCLRFHSPYPFWMASVSMRSMATMVTSSMASLVPSSMVTRRFPISSTPLYRWVFLFSWTDVCASLHVALHKIIIIMIIIASTSDVCRWQLTTSQPACATLVKVSPFVDFVIILTQVFQ